MKMSSTLPQVGEKLLARGHAAVAVPKVCFLRSAALVSATCITEACAFGIHRVHSCRDLRRCCHNTSISTIVAPIAILAITAKAPRAVLDAWGALVLSALMMVTVATSLRLHPAVGLGCVAAAASCRGSDKGSAGAVPPPRFPLGGWDTRRRSRSASRCLAPLQVFKTGRCEWRVLVLPITRPLAAAHLGVGLRGGAVRPQ